MSEVLQNERQKATFEINELVDLLNGGPEETKKRKRLESLIYNNPVFQRDDRFFQTREEAYDYVLEAVKEFVRICKRENIQLKHDDENFHRLLISVPDELPINVFYGMFAPTIMDQGTEEQQQKWLPLIRNFKIIGTYAQTELAHGTFVRGLETTATYDPARREFILNSPTVSSIKWWPGGLAKTANFAIIPAQLYTKGKCYGIHMFIVQLRSLEDHKPLPGIAIGDIGNKFGFDTIDNGYLRLENVRIPYENMLMKYAKVTPRGDYIPPSNPKIAYGTMTLVRVGMTKESSTMLAACSTIAIRYSAVRHQSEIRPGEEPQVLHYRTQQFKLFPMLATAFAFHFAGNYMIEVYFKIHSELSHGQFNALSELHGISAGLKAYTSDVSIAGMEVCRRACGGHGYSNACGIQHFYGMWLPSVTFEGDNTVMYLQVARYLLKCYRNQRELPDSLSYLKRSPAGDKWSVTSLQDLSDFDKLIAAFERRALCKITYAAKRLHDLVNVGMDEKDAWVAAGIELVACAKAHCHYFIVKNYLQSIKKLKMSTSLREVMNAFALLYANHGIDDNAGEFMETGFVNGQQIHLVKMKIIQLLQEIKPNAVAVVDSFDFNDRYLRSALGAYDGDVYNRIYKWAKNAPLNKTQVHSSYDMYLKHLLKPKL